MVLIRAAKNKTITCFGNERKYTRVAYNPFVCVCVCACLFVCFFVEDVRPGQWIFESSKVTFCVICLPSKCLSGKTVRYYEQYTCVSWYDEEGLIEFGSLCFQHKRVGFDML